MKVYRLAAVVFIFVCADLCFMPAYSEGIANHPWDIQGQGPDGSLYRIQAGLHGEIYPVFANYASFQSASQRPFGVITITISNPSPASQRRTISVQIPGWSDQEIQAAELEGGATRTLVFAPTFLPRFYQNREIVAATANISVADVNGRLAYQATVPVRLRSCEDIFWGEDFLYARFVASWVTPHDSLVESLLARARQYTADGRLPGYEDWKTPSQQEMETYREARAIFTALRRSRLSYVKSSLTLGENARWSERVRMPRVSLSNGSANCIDAAVLYASLFENLGMDAEVVLVPGHAYAGVRVAATSGNFLLIDAALTGRSTFEAAVASAERGMSRLRRSSVIEIKIPQARAEGIYPLPSPAP